MTKATFAIAIDWTDDNDFVDTGEVVTSRVLHNPGITVERGRDQIRSLSPPMAGACSFSLNNQSKDYSPANVSSPLYGNLLPGRAVKITADGSPFWRGNVDDLPQQPRIRGGAVAVPALGNIARLRGVNVSTILYTNITTDQAFGYLMAAAGLTVTTEYVALDTGQTTFTAWWCDDVNALTMLNRILDAEGPGAAVYEDASGVITFHSRYYRLLTTRGNTSQATFGNASTEPRHSPPFGYQPNLKGIVNAARMDVSQLTIGSYTLLFTYPGATLPIGPGQSVTLAIPHQSTPFDLPIWNIDSSDVTPSESTASTSVVTTATSSALTITNPNARTITYQGITMQAKPGTIASYGVANTIDTSASQGKYGKRTATPQAGNDLATLTSQKATIPFDPWPYLSLDAAQGLCDALVTLYQEPRATVTITVKNANSTRLAQQLARDISDRVTVQESQTGFSGTVYIERIKHVVTGGGLFHTTEFGCEETGPYGETARFETGSFETGRFGF